MVRSDAIALETTFPTPFVDTPTVLVSVVTTRWAASYDRALYPSTVTPTGFSISSIVIDDSGLTTVSGYLAIGRWK